MEVSTVVQEKEGSSVHGYGRLSRIKRGIKGCKQCMGKASVYAR